MKKSRLVRAGFLLLIANFSWLRTSCARLVFAAAALACAVFRRLSGGDFFCLATKEAKMPCGSNQKRDLTALKFGKEANNALYR
ncbi:hypothetical protein [Flavobacterium sp.]|uniref:hypothetical protein n=1 Tax=Flavobacterium sp. TaxID=239 RepID=UPI00122194B9|nr:hypothetical protein [Flavobacterium sp.]RZJ69002.1 MAG: hypothetical protein EOO49_18835 [Flavobacterium sp.]